MATKRTIMFDMDITKQWMKDAIEELDAIKMYIQVKGEDADNIELINKGLQELRRHVCDIGTDIDWMILKTKVAMRNGGWEE